MKAEELKFKYPHADYCDMEDVIYADKEENSPVVEQDGQGLVEDYFEGREITTGLSGGLSPHDRHDAVTGYQYVKIVFQGNYKKAFNSIH